MQKTKVILSLLLILTLLSGCAVSAAMLPPTEPAVGVTPTEAPTRLTAEEARVAALKDAGLNADAVTGLRTEFEIDDGVPEYEVDFRSGDYEYDYTIHAETGVVRSRSKEYDPVKSAPPATQPPETQPAPPPAAKPAADEKITADRAVAIALKHVGLTRGDVTELEVEYDVDDGVPEYDVEFRQGSVEYSFEIHAETGKILDFDRDD